MTTIDNLRLEEALRFFTDEQLEIRLRATRRGDQVRCSLLSDFKNRKGFVLRQDRVHSECIVKLDEVNTSSTTGLTSEVQFPNVDFIPM